MIAAVGNDAFITFQTPLPSLDGYNWTIMATQTQWQWSMPQNISGSPASGQPSPTDVPSQYIIPVPFQAYYSTSNVTLVLTGTNGLQNLNSPEFDLPLCPGESDLASRDLSVSSFQVNTF